MSTPYEIHEKTCAGGGNMSRHSPNGVDIIEECDKCGQRWIHNPCIGYPVQMRPVQEDRS